MVRLKAEDLNKINTGALRVIFLEIYSESYKKLIQDILGDSPAGYYLKSMEAHSKELEEKYREHEINNSPKIVEENRRRKKEFKAKVHNERIIKYNKFSFIRKYWSRFKNMIKK